MKTQTEINFTKIVLLALESPEKGKIRYYDAKEKGLGLYVTSSGHKSFFIKKRIKGQPKEIILGHFPEMTVEIARKTAQKIKLEVMMGQDPTKEKEKLAAEKTFGEAYEMHMDRHARVEYKPSTLKEIERQMRKVLPYRVKRGLSSITRQDAQEMHDRIGRENGKYEANRALAYIRAIYNKMINWGLTEKNPAAGIQKFKEQKRDRFILHDELPKFMEALEMEPNRDMRDFFLICLYTGARCGNVMSMRWEDIDFSIKEWRIPDTKSGEPVRIPLIGKALDILNNRLCLKESMPWVFPSRERKKSKSGHLEEPKAAWNRILERAGLKNLRIHDLRRTNGSYQAIAGASLTIIGKSLGHKSPQSTAIYARLSNDPVRTSVEEAFDFTTKNQ
ncbi:MAG: tyrosine-type recombinase/integrase [Puniceicoccales bacterium]|jgi:integrase|nr:tyrosine-type recombinase/integrase [Puniceicoccales bacterium]